MTNWCGNARPNSALFGEAPGPNEYGATEDYDSFVGKVQTNWAKAKTNGLAGDRLSGKGLRYGQVFFNTLSTEHPNLAERIRSTPRDPFHKDEVVVEIWEYCSEMWDTTSF